MKTRTTTTDIRLDKIARKLGFEFIYPKDLYIARTENEETENECKLINEQKKYRQITPNTK